MPRGQARQRLRSCPRRCHRPAAAQPFIRAARAPPVLETGGPLTGGAAGDRAARRARTARLSARHARSLLRPGVHPARLAAGAARPARGSTCCSKIGSPGRSGWRPPRSSAWPTRKRARDSSAIGTVAATQISAERHGLVLGEVDDMNAFAMGGIAGHAGLFSTAGDLAAIATALVAAFRGDGDLVARDVIRRFWSPSGVPGSTWRLGWDGPARVGIAGGREAVARQRRAPGVHRLLALDRSGARGRRGSALQPGPPGGPDRRSVPPIQACSARRRARRPSVMMDAE